MSFSMPPPPTPVATSSSMPPPPPWKLHVHIVPDQASRALFVEPRMRFFHSTEKTATIHEFCDSVQKLYQQTYGHPLMIKKCQAGNGADVMAFYPIYQMFDNSGDVIRLIEQPLPGREDSLFPESILRPNYTRKRAMSRRPSSVESGGGPNKRRKVLDPDQPIRSVERESNEDGTTLVDETISPELQVTNNCQDNDSQFSQDTIEFPSCPTSSKSHWTPQLDTILLASREIGLSWTDTKSQHFPTMSIESIRGRYRTIMSFREKFTQSSQNSHSDRSSQIRLASQKSSGNKARLTPKSAIKNPVTIRSASYEEYQNSRSPAIFMGHNIKFEPREDSPKIPASIHGSSPPPLPKTIDDDINQEEWTTDNEEDVADNEEEIDNDEGDWTTDNAEDATDNEEVASRDVRNTDVESDKMEAESTPTKQSLVSRLSPLTVEMDEEVGEDEQAEAQIRQYSSQMVASSQSSQRLNLALSSQNRKISPAYNSVPPSMPRTRKAQAQTQKIVHSDSQLRKSPPTGNFQMPSLDRMRAEQIQRDKLRASTLHHKSENAKQQEESSEDADSSSTESSSSSEEESDDEDGSIKASSRVRAKPRRVISFQKVQKRIARGN